MLDSGKRVVRFGWILACLKARERVSDEAYIVRSERREMVASIS